MTIPITADVVETMAAKEATTKTGYIQLPKMSM